MLVCALVIDVYYKDLNSFAVYCICVDLSCI